MKDLRTKEKLSIRSFFDEQTRFLDFRLSWWQRLKGHKQHKKQLENAMEQLVELTNSRIKIVANYRKKLRMSVAKLQHYVDSLVAEVEGQPFHNIDKFNQDDYLQAMFFEEKLCDDFFDTTTDVNDHFFILTSVPHYKEVLMPALKKGELIQDVRSTVLNFKYKHIEYLVQKESEVTQTLKLFFIDRIIKQIKKEIEPHMALGYHELKNAPQNTTPLSPKAYLKAIVELLKSPEQLFSLHKISISTDRFGVVCDNPIEKNIRNFSYLFCQPKHSQDFALCLAKKSSNLLIDS